MRDHLRSLRSGTVAFVWTWQARLLSENRPSVLETISSARCRGFPASRSELSQLVSHVTSWQNNKGGRSFDLLDVHCVVVQIDHSTNLFE